MHVTTSSGGGEILNGMQPQPVRGPEAEISPMGWVDLYQQRSQNNELMGKKNAVCGEVWAARTNWFSESGWEEQELSLPREQD